MTVFSQRLKETLEKKGIKQTDLAKSTGIDKSLISNYLSGKYKAKSTNLYLIAKSLDVSEAWLLGYDVQMEKETSTEERLLNDFRSLSEQGKEYILKTMELLKKENIK